MENAFVIRKDKPEIRARRFLRKVDFVQERTRRHRWQIKGHDSERRKTRIKPCRTQTGSRMGHFLVGKLSGNSLEQLLAGAGRNISLQDALAAEVVNIVPSIQQQIGIAWSHAADVVDVEKVLFFEPPNNLAYVSVIKPRLAGKFGLSLESLLLKKKLPCDSRALGGEHIRRPASATILVGAAFNAKPEPWSDDVGIPREI